MLSLLTKQSHVHTEETVDGAAVDIILLNFEYFVC
jgi:hypothetical protein